MTRPEVGVIESYLDEVPRATATVVDLRTLTIFAADRQSFPYYARPRQGRTGPVRKGDLAAALSYQAANALPQAVEWIDELAPELAELAVGAGLEVRRYPLMILRKFVPHVPPEGFRVRIVTEDAEDLALLNLTIGLGFRQLDTRTGDLGTEVRDREALTLPPAATRLREEIRAGRFVLAAAEGDEGAVAGGSFSPRGGVAEITGISTLPAFRRRGIGSAVTTELVREAVRREVGTCFLSASSKDVANIYAQLGFQQIATACAAETP